MCADASVLPKPSPALDLNLVYNIIIPITQPKFYFLLCPTHPVPREVDWFSLISVVGLLCFAPFIVFSFVMACDQYQCSITQPVLELIQGETTLLTIWSRTSSFTWSAAKIYAFWVAFQVNS